MTAPADDLLPIPEPACWRFRFDGDRWELDDRADREFVAHAGYEEEALFTADQLRLAVQQDRERRQEPETAGDARRHVICLCPDCVAPAKEASSRRAITGRQAYELVSEEYAEMNAEQRVGAWGRLARVWKDHYRSAAVIANCVLAREDQGRGRRQEALSQPAPGTMGWDWVLWFASALHRKPESSLAEVMGQLGYVLAPLETHAEADRPGQRLPCWLNSGGCIEPNYCRAPTEEAPHPALCAKNDTRAGPTTQAQTQPVAWLKDDGTAAITDGEKRKWIEHNGARDAARLDWCERVMPLIMCHQNSDGTWRWTVTELDKKSGHNVGSTFRAAVDAAIAAHQPKAGT